MGGEPPVISPGTLEGQAGSFVDSMGAAIYAAFPSAAGAYPVTFAYTGAHGVGPWTYQAVIIVEASASVIGGAITALTGDVTAAGPGSKAPSTVVGVNGAAVPPSQAVLGSNSSGQLIAGTASLTNPMTTVGDIIVGGTAEELLHA